MTNILQNPKGISHANAHTSALGEPSAYIISQMNPGAVQMVGRKSLNRDARRRELMKITREN